MGTFHYRRELKPRENLPAVGAGVAAGLAVGAAAFYLARIYLQRTPLETPPPIVDERGVTGPRAGRPLRG